MEQDPGLVGAVPVSRGQGYSHQNSCPSHTNLYYGMLPVANRTMSSYQRYVEEVLVGQSGRSQEYMLGLVGGYVQAKEIGRAWF